MIELSVVGGLLRVQGGMVNAEEIVAVRQVRDAEVLLRYPEGVERTSGDAMVVMVSPEELRYGRQDA